MKKVKRVLAFLLALVLAAGLLSSFALAARSISRRGNSTIMVETGKAPWYFWWQSPQITVKNEGKQPLTILVTNEKGQLVKQLTSLKSGKSHHFDLKGNQSYEIGISANSLYGGKPEYTVTAKRHIRDMW